MFRSCLRMQVVILVLNFFFFFFFFFSRVAVVTPKNSRYIFVLINSVFQNLSRVWILSQNASSDSCFSLFSFLPSLFVIQELLLFLLPLVSVQRVKNTVLRWVAPRTLTSQPSEQRSRADLMECVVCGDWPVHPHHIGCNHVFCHYCIAVSVCEWGWGGWGGGCGGVSV